MRTIADSFHGPKSIAMPVGPRPAHLPKGCIRKPGAFEGAEWRDPSPFPKSLTRSGMPPTTAAPNKSHWTTHVGQAAAHPAAFVIVIAYAVLWLIFDRATFEWNAIATLAVWIMTLFIQRANRRDSLALHAKLDELLRVDQQARSELVRLDEQEPEVIERHRNAEVHKAAE
jgi:low affinity Fe/Cu permease